MRFLTSRLGVLVVMVGSTKSRRSAERDLVCAFPAALRGPLLESGILSPGLRPKAALCLGVSVVKEKDWASR
jgi:hypothetical protein